MHRHVSVVPARWWHLPGLISLLRNAAPPVVLPARFESGTALLWAPGWSPSVGLLRSLWSSSMAGVAGAGAVRCVVAEYNGHPVALGQMRRRLEPHQWEVTFLATADGDGYRARQQSYADQAGMKSDLPTRTAARVLGSLCDAAVAHHAERLLARLPEEGAGHEVFRQLGFSSAVREHTYALALPGVPGAAGAPVAVRDGQGASGDAAAAEAAAPGAWPRPEREISRSVSGLRAQRRADAFGVLQLYLASTPKMVQMAEGKRPLSWELPTGAPGGHLATPLAGLTRRARRRWVVERESRKVAWLQVTYHNGGPHEVRLMVDEAHSDLASPLLELARRATGAHPRHGVLVRVREYQPAVLQALEAHGFVLVETRLLMVKLLATPVLQPQFARALEKVV